MSETTIGTEGFENFNQLPTEEAVLDVITQICAGRECKETNRNEQEGKLRSLEIRLDEPNAEGLIMQLEYSVSKKGIATVDVAYFDPTVGFNYREYDPRDIVPGKRLGRFEEGVWISENELFESTQDGPSAELQSLLSQTRELEKSRPRSPEEATFENSRAVAVEALGYTVESNDGKWLTLTKNGYTINLKHFSEPSNYGYNNGRVSMLLIRKNTKQFLTWDSGFLGDDEDVNYDPTNEEVALKEAGEQQAIMFRELMTALS